ncbi:MAG: large conductance mechanosensitive channel protein MscL [Coriobacteriales bacterium]|nr:large conductance mechanosensitive channel protein MscL [Coriobacteriales bacterium]
MRKPKWLGEFRDFINRGNVIDLSIGIVVGGAFTAIVNSVVNNLLTPFISLFTRGVDFSTLKVTWGIGSDAATFNYGLLVQAIINFFVIALVVFFMIKGINKLRKPQHGDPSIKTCPYCATEIPAQATRCPHCTSKLGTGYIYTVRPEARKRINKRKDQTTPSEQAHHLEPAVNPPAKTKRKAADRALPKDHQGRRRTSPAGLH